MLFEKREISLKNDLFIDDSSWFKLNQCFKSHSNKHIEWIKIAANAGKEVARLKLQLKIKAAEIVVKFKDQYLKEQGKPIPVSYDIKGTVLPLNKNWVKLNKELAEAYEVLEIARGACDSFVERGYLLKEVAKFNEQSMTPSVTFQSQDDKLKQQIRTYEGGEEAT